MADSPFIIDVTRDNFRQFMETSFKVPVLLDFWAAWCQPCQILMPVLARLAEDYQGKFLLAKLDTEKEPEIAAQFGIRGIPNVKLFRDGHGAAARAHAERSQFRGRRRAPRADESVRAARGRLAGKPVPQPHGEPAALTD